jgi:type IV pilus assembly protein PilN
MIRINLLPVRKQKARSSSVMQLGALAGAAVVSVAAALGVNLYFANEVETQEKAIAETRDEISRLKQIIGEVNELDKQKQRLIAQLSVIDKLEKGKRGPVRVLDELSSNIPKRVWITSFEESNGTLVLKGLGLENADISEFMRSLQKSKYFKEIRLQYTQSEPQGGISIYGFQLTAGVDYSA